MGLFDADIEGLKRATLQALEVGGLELAKAGNGKLLPVFPYVARVVFDSKALSQLEEGQSGSSAPVAILLPDGKRLGFKRINSAAEWQQLFNRHGSKLRRKRTGSTLVITIKEGQRDTPIYKIQPRPRIRGRPSILATAQKIADRLPEKILRYWNP